MGRGSDTRVLGTSGRFAARAVADHSTRGGMHFNSLFVESRGGAVTLRSYLLLWRY